jgi:hypothetical protein
MFATADKSLGINCADSPGETCHTQKKVQDSRAVSQQLCSCLMWPAFPDGEGKSTTGLSDKGAMPIWDEG